MSTEIHENKKNEISRKKDEKLLSQHNESDRKKCNVDFELQNKDIKQSDEEVEVRLNAIVNASIDGIINFDRVGNILSINKAAINIFGYSEEELIGHSLNRLLLFEQREKKHVDIESYLRGKLPSGIGLIRGIHGLCKDGSTVFLDISLVKYSLTGKDCYVSILRDVGFRIKQKQQEKDNLEELAKIAHFCLIGEKGVGIVHEINQSLTAIVNYTYALLRFIDAKKPNFEQIRETLHKINQQTLKARQIVQHTKDFVRQPKLYRVDKNINALVEDTLSLCVNDFRQGDIKVKIELAKNIPDVVIDDVQIEQVLLNLLRNSIEALQDVKQKTQRHLSVQSHLINVNHMEIRIKDNGIGINEAQKKKILSPFYSTKRDGMGIGLSISRLIIEAHDGVFHFNSKPKKGSTFYFTLPVKGKLSDG